MKEILFRGKRIDNDEWTEGYLFKSWNRTFLIAFMEWLKSEVEE